MAFRTSGRLIVTVVTAPSLAVRTLSGSLIIVSFIQASNSVELKKDPGALFLVFSSSSWALTIVAEGSISFAYRLSETDLLRPSDEVESFLSVASYPIKNGG
jgi:hypothetical protein